MRRKTKIICTLGPATDEPEVLKAAYAEWDELRQDKFFSWYS